MHLRSCSQSYLPKMQTLPACSTNTGMEEWQPFIVFVGESVGCDSEGKTEWHGETDPGARKQSQ